MFSSSGKGDEQDGGTQWVPRVLCGQILVQLHCTSEERGTQTQRNLPWFVCLGKDKPETGMWLSVVSLLSPKALCMWQTAAVFHLSDCRAAL